MGSLLLAVAGLLLLMQLGELEAELDALGMVFRMLRRLALLLSLLDVDSERCNGKEARRWLGMFTCISDTVGNGGNEKLS